MNKRDARKLALLERRDKDQSMASSIVLDAICSSLVLEGFTHIGIYYPIGKEISILGLMEKYPDKKFYLPVTKEEISFLPYTKDTPLIPGPFHTMEPEGCAVERDSIECFILPCVAVTQDGRRIGYGKGYYDRYLEGYTGYKIGIVYETAVCDAIGDSFDVALDIVFKG